VLRLLSGCRHAHAESAIGSVAVRWLRRADLGTEEIACRTAQNLYSLHRSRRPGKLMQTFAVAFQTKRAAGLELLRAKPHARHASAPARDRNSPI
jgi:hypothetical protein